MPATADYHILSLDKQGPEPDLVRSGLEQAGFVIDVVSKTLDGLALAAARQFDAILLNPQLFLTDTLTTMQELLGASGAPLIVVAHGSLAPPLLDGCSQLDVAAYFFLATPNDDLQRLALLLEQVIGRRRARLEQERMLRALQQDNRNLMLLTRLAHLISSTLEADQIISQLVQAITEIVITEGSSVWLWDSEHPGALVCAAMYLHGQNITAEQISLPPAGIVGWVAHAGQAVNVQEVGSDPRFSALVDGQTGYSTRSILAVPLVTRNQIIGVLEFVNKLEGPFNERDGELAETVAAYAANAIENARLMASLSRQRDRLERQNEALDAFAYSVAHDLKNPLTLVVGFADLLRDGISTMSPTSIGESLDTIVEYGIKMNHIVDALLMLANVGSDDAIDVEPVDMGAVITAVLRRIGHMIKEYNALVQVPVEWPLALGDSSWLEEVWYNYLSNGLKYGGRPPHLELGFDPPEAGMVRFWVGDNGPGLSTDNPLTLFSPQRGRRTRTSNGHGLGLSIVQRIITRLGGKVDAENISGGSRFSFTLPAAPADASME